MSYDTGNEYFYTQQTGTTIFDDRGYYQSHWLLHSTNSKTDNTPVIFVHIWF